MMTTLCFVLYVCIERNNFAVSVIGGIVSGVNVATEGGGANGTLVTSIGISYS